MSIILKFQELADIKAAGLKSFRDIEVDDRNILIWSGLVCPVSIILNMQIIISSAGC